MATKRRAIAAVVVTALVASGCTSVAPPAPPSTTPVGATPERPVIVVVRADWCAACRAVAPAVAWLHEEYGDRVTIVELDVTDAAAEAGAAATAERLGLGPFYAANGGRTGITVLGRDHRTVRTLPAERRPGPYRSALEEAFATFDGPAR